MVQKSRALIATLLVAALVTAGAAPPSARVVERFTNHVSFSFDLDNICGVDLPVTYTTDFTITGTIRTRGEGGPEWRHERVRIVETFTHAGMTVTVIQPGVLSKDLKIVDNGDGTLEVTSLLTGGARLIGGDGKLLAKDDGQIRLRYTVDAESGEILSDELIFGPTGTNDDFCAAMLAHWGL